MICYFFPISNSHRLSLASLCWRSIPPYRIFGACNPALADRAIAMEPSIGLLLPCNVVVRQDDAGHVQVEFMNTDAVLQLVDSAEVAELATEVRKRLARVMAAM